ncbi:cutinase family protein [Nocardia implantans]|uniref:Cutinase family protein n=2 Tax=Nocardiaceae TaxID=85025 RepID=A0ABU6APD9_9NOCA|nr:MULTISPECIES: cutinase family protein [unclassified Nocardia]MEA3527100.1 cutinase family protein [Nocardia sp. CDC192]MEB3509322.1 cutinase family protein [Nocardia sp. CDC186]
MALSCVGTGSGPAVAEPECPSMYVVAIPGTWETTDRPDGERPGPGMLAGVTNGLPPSVRVDYVSYAATAFPWESEVYGASKREAVDNARGMIGAMARACGATKIALLGYSQGADAAGDLAAEIGTGLGVVPPQRIAAVGLISDPRRSPTDALVGPPVGGAGAGGPRIGGFGWVTPQTRTICAVGDLYCATASDDFVTRFAGFLAQTSHPDPADLWRYQLEMGAIVGDLMSNGGIPLLQSQLSESANQERARLLDEFYRSEAHTAYGSYRVDGRATALTWMHDWLASLA